MVKVILSLVFIFIMSSCSSMSEKECMNANWYKKGIADAEEGKPKTKLGDYKNACMRNGIEFDSEEYIEGYEKGLTSK